MYTPPLFGPFVAFIALVLACTATAMPIFTISSPISTSSSSSGTLSYEFKLFETCISVTLNEDGTTATTSLCTSPSTSCSSFNKSRIACIFFSLVSCIVGAFSVFFGVRRSVNPDLYNVGGLRLRFSQVVVVAGICALLSLLISLAIFVMKFCGAQNSFYSSDNSSVGLHVILFIVATVLFLISPAIDLNKNKQDGMGMLLYSSSSSSGNHLLQTSESISSGSFASSNGNNNNKNSVTEETYKRAHVVTTSQKRREELNRAIAML